MAVKVEVNYSKSIECDRKPADTYAYLADLDLSIPKNFPGVERFEQISPGTYRWIFEKVVQGGYEIQIKLDTRVEHRAPRRIEMAPVHGSGTGSINGFWEIEPAGEKAKVTFKVDLHLDLPLPFFLKAVAAPLVQRELSKLFDRYLANVAKALT